MQLRFNHNLPFVSLSVQHAGKSIEIHSVLLDTGSASTILSADLLSQINVVPEPNDPLRTIRGVGGTEVVFRRRLDMLKVSEMEVENFVVEVGAMDYGFEINGILGMDFLLKTGAQIDLKKKMFSF